MKKIRTILALLIVLGFISTLVGGVGYVYGNPDGVTVNFEGASDAENYIASKTNLVVSGGQVKLSEIVWACGSPFTDSRDGKTYATVQIGSQCWMKQGLNIGTRIAGGSNQGTSCSSIQKYCYSNSDANCTSNNPNYPDGALYQWDQAMCGSTTEGVQGICPSGWHLPTDAQWCILEQAVDPSISCSATGWRGTDGGTKLKPNGTAGFEGNLAGEWFFMGIFSARTASGYFWSSTQYNVSAATYRALGSGDVGVHRAFPEKAEGFSVRCLKD